MQFMDMLETYDAAHASIQNLFQGDGTGVRTLVEARRSRNPQMRQKYDDALARAAEITADVFEGRRSMAFLKEALSTDDFPLLFGDTIDRLMLAKYRTITPVWKTFVHQGKVADFRPVKRFRATRGSSMTDPVPPGGSYKADGISESYYTFSVAKFGRRRDILMEALINDDLDALKDAPGDLAYQAANREAFFATGLYAANGTLFATSGGGRPTGGNKGTAKLTVENLQAAITQMSALMDDSGIPMLNTPKFLVVPPQLELDALKILRSVQLMYTGGTDVAAQPTLNVLQGMLTPVVDPFLPLCDQTNGKTGWYLFSDPADGWAIDVAFLSGHETPELYMKIPNQVALGGAGGFDGDFETDSKSYKVTHVVGGTHTNAVGGWRFGYYSDGTA